MEYQFYQDTLSGIYRAAFSVEHQIIGHWLETEVSSTSSKIDSVYQILSTAGFSANQVIAGREYTLVLTNGEVEVIMNSSFDSELIPERLIIDGLQYDSLESAGCGLDDFLIMLKMWSDFVQ